MSLVDLKQWKLLTDNNVIILTITFPQCLCIKSNSWGFGIITNDTCPSKSPSFPSGNLTSNLWRIETKYKNTSSLAKGSPGHALLPKKKKKQKEICNLKYFETLVVNQNDFKFNFFLHRNNRPRLSKMSPLFSYLCVFSVDKSFHFFFSIYPIGLNSKSNFR